MTHRDRRHSHYPESTMGDRRTPPDLEYGILDCAVEDEYILWELAPGGGAASAESIAATQAVILDLHRRGLVCIGFRPGPTVRAIELPVDAISAALDDPVWWGPNTESAMVVWATDAGTSEYQRQAAQRFPKFSE